MRRTLTRRLLGLAVACAALPCGDAIAGHLVTTADGVGADTFLENDNQGFSGTDPTGTAANVRGASQFLQFRRFDTVRQKLLLLRFDISTLDSAHYADARLLLDVFTNRNRTMRVYAIADGPLEMWDEATTNYLSAPGILDMNDTPAGPDAVAAAIGLNPTELYPGHLTGGGPNPFQLGVLNVADTRGNPTGRGYFVSDPSTLDLLPLLTADTNGVVSFLLFHDGSDSSQTGDVRAKEGVVEALDLAPQLGIISAVFLPEPTTGVLAALGLIGFVARRR